MGPKIRILLSRTWVECPAPYHWGFLWGILQKYLSAWTLPRCFYHLHFGRTIPNWDLGSKCIGVVSIILPLYLILKVDISDTYSSDLYNPWFIQMIISSLLSVLTVVSEFTIGSSNCPIPSENTDTFGEYSCTTRVLHTFPRIHVSEVLSFSIIPSKISYSSYFISATLLNS